MPGDSSRFVVTSRDEASGTLLARNPLAEDHGGEVAFAVVLAGATASPSWTTDRAAFVGRGATMQAPRAVEAGGALDGRAGPEAADPCFAFEVPVTLAPRGEVEVVFAIGQAADRDEALAQVARLREAGAIDAAFDETRASWKDLTSALEVQTPSKSIDLMVNGWLLYQTLACRLWGRTAFYQSGGAFGFRDQLQDSLALLTRGPTWSREQILLQRARTSSSRATCSTGGTRPPAAACARTSPTTCCGCRSSPADYIRRHRRRGVLDERARLPRRPRAARRARRDAYAPAARRPGAGATLYEHCCRALEPLAGDRRARPAADGHAATGTTA